MPQPVVETGARHLQVGLAGSQKVDVLSCLVGFFSRLPWLPSWNFQDPNITELYSLCSQDCEVIGWAELCERKKLTAGCFQLQWLGHRRSEECNACVLVVGWIWLDKGAMFGPKLF